MIMALVIGLAFLFLRRRRHTDTTQSLEPFKTNAQPDVGELMGTSSSRAELETKYNFQELEPDQRRVELSG